MKIDATYDLVCPWCHLGMQRLARALERSRREDVTIELWPFQLAPEVPEHGVDHFEFFANRVGADRAREIYASMETLADREGSCIRYDRIQRLPNTARAHRLVLGARSRGRAMDTAIALMRAHFVHGLDIGAEETLASIAVSQGIDERWDHPELEAQLAHARERARRMGISGVPHFSIDGRPQQGAISAEQWKSLLGAA